MAWEQLQPLSKWVQRQPLGLARSPWRKPLGSWKPNEATPSPAPGMVAPKPVAKPALGFNRPPLMPSEDGGSRSLPIPGEMGVLPAIQASEDALPSSPSPDLSKVAEFSIGDSTQLPDAPDSPGLPRTAASEPGIQTRSKNPIPSVESSPESNPVEPGLPQAEPATSYPPVPSRDWPILVQRQPLGHHRPLAPRPSLAKEDADSAADFTPIQLQPDRENLTTDQPPQDGEPIPDPAPAGDLRSPAPATPVPETPSFQLTADLAIPDVPADTESGNAEPPAIQPTTDPTPTPQTAAGSPATTQPAEIQTEPLRGQPIAETVAGEETPPSPQSPVSPDLQETAVPEISADTSPRAPSLQPQSEGLAVDAPTAITPDASTPQLQPETPAADSITDIPTETSPKIPTLQPQLESPLTDAITDTTPEDSTPPGLPHLRPQLEAPLTDSSAGNTPKVPTLQPQGETAAADAVNASDETVTELSRLHPQLETRLTDSPADADSEVLTRQPEGDSPAANIAADTPTVLPPEPPRLQPQLEAPSTDVTVDTTHESPAPQPERVTPAAAAPGVPTETSAEPPSLQPQVETFLTDSTADATPESPTVHPQPEASSTDLAAASPKPFTQLQSQTDVEISALERFDVQRVPEDDSVETVPDADLLSPSASDADLAPASATEPSPSGEPPPTSSLATDHINQFSLQRTIDPELTGTEPTDQPEVMPHAEVRETAPTDDAASFSGDHVALQAFSDSQATDAPDIPLQRAEQRETTTAADEPQTEDPQPENQGSDLVEQATPKLPVPPHSVLQARQQEPWQDQFKLEPGPSPTSLKPWQQQFQLDAPVEQLSTSNPPGIAPKEDAAATAAVSHQLISPVARSAQSEPGESAQVNDQQLEQLAHICYGLVRSHLLTYQEIHHGVNNLGPSWADVSFLPSLTAKPNSETQISMSSKTLELDALSLAWDKNISELCQEVQNLLQFKLTLERDRSPGKVFTRLGR